MRQLLILLIASFTLTNCAVKVIPIQGTYLEPPFQIKTDKSPEQVWDGLIDLFAQKGFSIKIIDHSSGLIISERSLLPATIENKNGELENKKAFIVVPKMYSRNTGQYMPVTYTSDVSGEWNVRIKKIHEQTQINVNIVNVKYESYNRDYKLFRDVVLVNYKSTGVFEKLIADMIK